MKRCFIFAAGTYYGLRERPQSGDLILAADAGYEVCRREGIVPDLVLGDFDSLRGDQLETLQKLAGTGSFELREYPPEKALAQYPELSSAACMAFLFMAGNIYRDTHKWLERQRKQQESARRRIAQEHGPMYSKTRTDDLPGKPWGMF